MNVVHEELENFFLKKYQYDFQAIYNEKCFKCILRKDGNFQIRINRVSLYVVN